MAVTFTPVATTVTAASATAITAHACKLMTMQTITTNLRAIPVAQGGGFTGVFIQSHFQKMSNRTKTEPQQARWSYDKAFQPIKKPPQFLVRACFTSVFWLHLKEYLRTGRIEIERPRILANSPRLLAAA
ncbi:MAG: hypothetical protein IPN53_05130 [Comamonadaceae bacterium]|nr:hypothetical protein [Comamonadaceae bacterium]